MTKPSSSLQLVRVVVLHDGVVLVHVVHGVVAAFEVVYVVVLV